MGTIIYSALCGELGFMKRKYIWLETHLNPRPCTLGYPKKALFWPYKLASKYMMTCHARNTLIRDGGSPLSFVPPPPGPQNVIDPYFNVENSQLSYQGRLMLIRSS